MFTGVKFHVPRVADGYGDIVDGITTNGGALEAHPTTDCFIVVPPHQISLLPAGMSNTFTVVAPGFINDSLAQGHLVDESHYRLRQTPATGMAPKGTRRNQFSQREDEALLLYIGKEAAMNGKVAVGGNVIYKKMIQECPDLSSRSYQSVRARYTSILQKKANPEVAKAMWLQTEEGQEWQARQNKADQAGSLASSAPGTPIAASSSGSRKRSESNSSSAARAPSHDEHDDFDLTNTAPPPIVTNWEHLGTRDVDGIPVRAEKVRRATESRGGFDEVEFRDRWGDVAVAIGLDALDGPLVRKLFVELQSAAVAPTPEEAAAVPQPTLAPTSSAASPANTTAAPAARQQGTGGGPRGAGRSGSEVAGKRAAATIAKGKEGKRAKRESTSGQDADVVLSKVVDMLCRRTGASVEEAIRALYVSNGHVLSAFTFLSNPSSQEQAWSTQDDAVLRKHMTSMKGSGSKLSALMRKRGTQQVEARRDFLLQYFSSRAW